MEQLARGLVRAERPSGLPLRVWVGPGDDSRQGAGIPPPPPQVRGAGAELQPLVPPTQMAH